VVLSRSPGYLECLQGAVPQPNRDYYEWRLRSDCRLLAGSNERQLLAEDCLLGCALKRPLSGKLAPKLDESAAVADPQPTLETDH